MKYWLKGLLIMHAVTAGFAGEMKNDTYTIRVEANKSVVVKNRDGAEMPLDMSFCVLHSKDDPDARLMPINVGVKYNVISWKSPDGKGASKSIAGEQSSSQVGDGFDPSILNTKGDGRTANLFHAASQVTVKASKAKETKDGLEFEFPDHEFFSLTAKLSLPKSGPPVLSYDFTPKKSGYYSVGYVGAPSHDFKTVDEASQPLIWQEKRFPDDSYMSLAFRCPVPATMVTRGGNTQAIVVDPDEFPFMPLPMMKNSRFGVAVRNREGRAQSMTFAPVLGLEGSLMKAKKTFSFRLRPMVVPGDTTVAFEDIARNLYGFRDYRSNSLCSLNTTMENMIDYGMSEYSRFLEAQKGCSYATDAPGTVKNVSSLNPIEMAIVTDDEAIFDRRGYPYVEYMLSRGKFLFTTDRKQKIQSPSYRLDGPCAPVSELAALYDVFGRGSAALLKMAEQEFNGKRVRNLNAKQSGKSWPNALAMYRVTGDQKYLDLAKKGADAYIETRIDRPSESFKDPMGESMFFWTQMAPRFSLLFDLYEATGEKRYLEAARMAARRFAQYVWMSPRIPEGEVLVNKGGKAPLYWYLKRKGHKQMTCPEEKAPAWRLSSVGLTAESVGTSSGHRAIFMANFAPWLIRIGYLTNDNFLRDLGRSAIVGRYRNFPGYHINTARTTVYEKADYPLRPHKELSVNSFHYNHIWPMISMLLDYLVSETFARSNGAIDFPTQYIEGYAYLQNKCYGTGKGRFYGAKDAILWMPKGLLKTDNIEVNYVAARGENALYLAFLNESDNEVTVQVTLNQSLVLKGSYAYRLADKAGKGQPTDGTFTVTIPARGLTAVTLDGVKITPKFQPKVMGLNAEDAWKVGYLKTEKPEGRAMILNLGKTVQNAYIYLVDGARSFKKVSLTYDMGGGKNTMTDTTFPFEFTVPLDKKATAFAFTITGVGKDGKTTETTVYKLEK